MYTHALIPQPNYTAARDACGWADFLNDCSNDRFINPTPACKQAVTAAISYVPMNDMDLYDIYSPKCLEPNTHNIDFSQYVRQWNPMFRSFGKDVSFAPCLTNYMQSYLNVPAVQSALHAKPTKWSWISYKLQYGSRAEIIIPLYKKFLQQTNWRILIVSGDTGR